jgi:hypothetical protein
MIYLHMKQHILALSSNRCITSQKMSNPGCFKTKERAPCTLGLGTAWFPKTIWKVWRREKYLAQSVMELIFICCQARCLNTLVLILTDLRWLHTVCDLQLNCAVANHETTLAMNFRKLSLYLRLYLQTWKKNHYSFICDFIGFESAKQT